MITNRFARIVMIVTLALSSGCARAAITPGLPPTATYPPAPAATLTPSRAATDRAPAARPTVTDAPKAPTATSSPTAAYDACKELGLKPYPGYQQRCMPPDAPTLTGSQMEEILFSKTVPNLVGYGWQAVPTRDGGLLLAGSASRPFGAVGKITLAGQEVWSDTVGFEIEEGLINREASINCLRVRELADGGAAALCYAFQRGFTGTTMHLLTYDSAGKRLSNELVKPKKGMALYLNAQGKVDWVSTFTLLDGGYVMELPGGGYGIAGTTSFNGSNDLTHLIRADQDKRYVWDMIPCARKGKPALPGQPNCHMNSLTGVTPTQDGGFALTGKDHTDLGHYLMKVDAGGKIEWVQRYPQFKPAMTTDLRQLPDGGYLISGNRPGDGLLIRTSADGKMLWEHTLGIPGRSESLNLLVPLANGDILAVGGSGSDLWMVGVGVLKVP